MKVIAVVWRDPSSSITQETFSADEIKVRNEPGWLKIDSKDGQPVRWIPSDKVCVVQFGDRPDEPRILRPDQVAQGGLKAVPS